MSVVLRFLVVNVWTHSSLLAESLFQVYKFCMSQLSLAVYFFFQLQVGMSNCDLLQYVAHPLDCSSDGSFFENFKIIILYNQQSRDYRL